MNPRSSSDCDSRRFASTADLSVNERDVRTVLEMVFTFL